MDRQTADDVMDHSNDAPAGELHIRVEAAPRVDLPDDDLDALESGSPGGLGAASSSASPSSPGGDDSIDLAALITPATVQPAVEAIYAAVARKRGPHWNLDADEAASIAVPLAGELSELATHAPFLGDALSVVGGRRLELVMALGFVTVPRLQMDGQIAAARANAQREASRAAPAPASEVRDVDSGGMASLMPTA